LPAAIFVAVAVAHAGNTAAAERKDEEGEPLGERKLAMGCGMYVHGVPIDDARDCRA
jgi:hypothetical protein